MISAAGLLVLAGLGLFLAGVLTGTTALYWVCVAVCGLAALLLLAARRRITRAEAAAPAAGSAVTTSPTSPTAAPALPQGAPSTAAERAGAPDATTGATSAAAVPASGPTAAGPAPTGAHAAGPARVAHTPGTPADPPVEDVEVTDLLLIVDLEDEVLVVDEHPRYHLPGCRFLTGRTGIPLPVDEARVDGFTPCALCAPDRNLADRERARKAGRTGT